MGVALPFNRSQESEADHIRLILMAKAGYDPDASAGLWQRMQSYSQGKNPPEWLSTYPAPATRVDDLRGWLLEARQYYQPSGQPIAALPPIPGAAADSSGAAGQKPH